MTVIEWSQVVGNLGEFLGAIAVVVTLIFLTSQMRQNTRALRANAREFGSNSYYTMATTIIPNEGLADLLAKAQRADPSQFTPGERERIAWFLVSCLKSAETQHVNWTDGMLDEDLYHPMMASLARMMASYPKYSPPFWSAARLNFCPSFQKLVDPIVENLK